MNKVKLLEEKISKLLVFFVIPTLFAEVISGIQGMVDGIFLGNFVDANAMASVNIATPYMQLILGGAMVVCTGTLSYLGRTLGENKIEKAQNIFKSCSIGLGILSLLFLVVGFVFSEKIALLLGANETLLLGTSQYIKILALFAPMLSYMLLFGTVGRLLGKPQLYLYSNIACLLTNVLADFITIKVLHLGIGGAAFSTGLAFTAGMLLVMQPLCSKESPIRLFEGHFKKKLFFEAAYNGSSEGITYVSSALALFLFNHAFITIAGEKGVAAFTIINYLGNFVSLMMFSVSDGIGSIVSYNYGAKRMDRMKKTFYLAMCLNLTMGIMVFVILNFFSKELIQIFVHDEPLIIEMAVKGAQLYGISFLFNGFNILQSGYQTSVGNAGLSFLIAACKGIIFISLGIYVLPILFDINGVWLTLPFAEFMSVLVCFIIMMKHKELYL